MKWCVEKLGDCFLDILCCLEKFLENKYCLYFFIFNVNLFFVMNVVIVFIFKDRVCRMVKLMCVVCGVVIMCKNR